MMNVIVRIHYVNKERTNKRRLYLEEHALPL